MKQYGQIAQSPQGRLRTLIQVKNPPQSTRRVGKDQSIWRGRLPCPWPSGSFVPHSGRSLSRACLRNSLQGYTMLACDLHRAIMWPRTNGWLLTLLGWSTAVLMFGARPHWWSLRSHCNSYHRESGRIATFRTPSRRSPKISYASPISSRVKVCVSSGIGSNRPDRTTFSNRRIRSFPPGTGW